MDLDSKLLDTTFLIDLQREIRGSTESKRASRFLEHQTKGICCISLMTCMEFEEGITDQHRDACEKFLTRFRLLLPDAETAWTASRISRDLRASGTPINDHDVWIAACAIQHDLLLVSRNRKHFERIPMLKLVVY